MINGVEIMKKFIYLILILILILPSIPSLAGDYTYDEMAAVLNSLEIFQGDGTGYNFEGMLTRAQFTKLAITASVYKNTVPKMTNTSPYSDVKYTHWAAGYIKVATANKVISGYPDSTFRPEGYVKTEEAVTILLKLLGYTNEDFGNEWPYGQMGIAANIGLTDDVTKGIGQELQRYDAVALIYNMLNLNTKDGSQYFSKIGCKLIEDAVIIASSKEDTTINPDKVYTSAGMFKVSDNFDFSNVGRTGDIVLKTANNEIAGFFPSKQGIASYTVDSVRGEDIWISDGGTARLLNAQSNTTVYEKQSESSLSNMVSKIDAGDKITVVTNENGYISYLLANLNEVLAFDDNSSEVYAVSAVLGNSLIVTADGINKALDIPASATAYYDSSKTTFSALASKASAGDIVSVVRDSAGEIRYVSVDSQGLNGPYTVRNSSIYTAYGIKSDASILKNGVKVSASDISVNDILYYSNALNTVWVYSDKKTGIYEAAYPNNEFPTSVTLSGKSYDIESSAAFTKLSAGGSFSYGSTVTLLLGRNGEIADVISPGAESVYGYVISAGKGTYQNASGSSYTSYYVEVATPDGYSYEYTTKTNYSSLKSKIVRVTFKDSYASLSQINESYSYSGKFDLSSMRLGTKKVASDVRIIEVKSDSSQSGGSYVQIYPARLNGITISKSQILYADENSNGEIEELILRNVTGDTYAYGIVINNKMESGGTYIVDGVTGNIKSGFSITSATPARFDMNGNTIISMTPLQAVKGGIISVTDSAVITKSGDEYRVSDKVSIYRYTGTEYMLTTIDEITSSDKYTITAYYDKAPEKGGRVRIIIAK